MHSFSANQASVIGVRVIPVIAQCNRTVDTSCLRISGRYALCARPVLAYFAEFFLGKRMSDAYFLSLILS